MTTKFSQADIEQMLALGISEDAISKQLLNFKNKFPHINLAAPATTENGGIVSLSDRQQRHYAELFDSECCKKQILKFVPASGAASRMFKDLAAFSSQYFGVSYNFEKEYTSVKVFFDNLEKFPFYDELAQTMQKSGMDIGDYIARKDFATVVNCLLSKNFMGYSSLPKALIKFHRYDGTPYPSIMEHFTEGLRYAKGKDKRINLHFTVSPEHREDFERTIRDLKKIYAESFNVTLSEQKHYTDTIAVDEYNEPLRDDDGKLIFRPGGHGALLENLNECNADIIFVKNIDNVTPDNPFHQSEEPLTVFYKKMLGGLLMEIQEKTFGYMKLMEKKVSEKEIAEIAGFAREQLHIYIPQDFDNQDIESRITYLRKKLDRPLRVCGMVKNEGEPGGGPFWVNDADGGRSLQIVETTQINRKDPVQDDILNSATHFNPVDLVCATRNYKGRRFDLRLYRDPNTGFITNKTQGAKTLKSQELPGLWNGSMAYWNTIFVEVPLLTFNPVKTVNDLLREVHQN